MYSSNQYEVSQGYWTFSFVIKCSLALTGCILLTSPAAIEARQVALPGPQCHPSIIRTMPARIQQICKALETIWEFNDTMEDYLDEKDEEDYASRIAKARSSPSVSQGALMESPLPPPGVFKSPPLAPGLFDASLRSVKRRSGQFGRGNRGGGSEPDHVFLRFGKRG